MAFAVHANIILIADASGAMPLYDATGMPRFRTSCENSNVAVTIRIPRVTDCECRPKSPELAAQVCLRKSPAPELQSVHAI